MSIEKKLAAWAAQAPGLRVSSDELQFIADMRRAAKLGVGFGWMMQVIEWEWQNVGGPVTSGPESFANDRREQEATIDLLEARVEMRDKQAVAAVRLANTVRGHLSLINGWIRCPDPLPISELRASQPYLAESLRAFDALGITEKET